MQSGASGKMLDENEKLTNQSDEIIACCISAGEESVKKVQALIEEKADVNKANKRRQLPLHMAAYYNRLDIVSVLMDAKADVTKQDSQYHSSALIEASAGLGEVMARKVMGSRLKIMRMLVEAKADTNQVDLEGRTAAHHTCISFADEHLPLLAELKADLFLKDNHGKTPFDIAKANDNTYGVQTIGKIILSQMTKIALSDLLISDLIKIVDSYIEVSSVDEVEKFMSLQTSLKR